MPNSHSLAHAAYPLDLREQIQDFAASQRRHLADLRELADILDPRGAPPAVPHDGYNCEICGRPVPVEAMSGFAARSGAVIHINCLTAQMEESR